MQRAMNWMRIHLFLAALFPVLAVVACGGHDEKRTDTQVIHNPDGSTTSVTREERR